MLINNIFKYVSARGVRLSVYDICGGDCLKLSNLRSISKGKSEKEFQKYKSCEGNQVYRIPKSKFKRQTGIDSISHYNTAELNELNAM